VKRAVPIALIRRNVQHGRRRISNARVLGTTPEYLQVKNLSVGRGRFLADGDLQTTANVAVLAAGAADRLFGYQDPLGKPLLIGESAYRIIGILAEQGSGSAAPGVMQQQDMNRDIYIPITAAQRRFGELQMIVRAGSREFERTQLSEITLTVHERGPRSPNRLDGSATARAATHRGSDDFEIQVPLELLRQAEHEKRIWNLVLGSIAGISLLVGGIGIMNIMLATVTERTREIGIRRALGGPPTRHYAAVPDRKHGPLFHGWRFGRDRGDRDSPDRQRHVGIGNRPPPLDRAAGFRNLRWHWDRLRCLSSSVGPPKWTRSKRCGTNNLLHLAPVSRSVLAQSSSKRGTFRGLLPRFPTSAQPFLPIVPIIPFARVNVPFHWTAGTNGWHGSLVSATAEVRVTPAKSKLSKEIH
jgi:hypothetical protein